MAAFLPLATTFNFPVHVGSFGQSAALMNKSNKKALNCIQFKDNLSPRYRCPSAERLIGILKTWQLGSWHNVRSTSSDIYLQNTYFHRLLHARTACLTANKIFMFNPLKTYLPIILLSLFRFTYGYQLKIYSPSPRRSVPLRAVVANDFYERLESIKSLIVSALSGSITSIPPALLIGTLFGLNSQWEFSHDALALSLALFGITYRYAIRNDDNSRLKEGVVAAFALTRALCLVEVPDNCSPFPLNCGPPFYYFTMPEIERGILNLIESFSAYGGSAFALDYCFKYNFIKKFV